MRAWLLSLLILAVVKADLACWETEEFEIKTHCRPCSKADKAEVCQKSGFIESIQCDSGKSEERPCGELPKYQSQLFWRFECLILLTGAGTAYFTFKRMRQLDYEHDERIKKQLSSL